MSPGGIDADALLSAHVDALSSTTYTFRTVRGGNASSVTRYERSLVSPTAQLRVRRQVADGTELDNTTQFVNATAAYRRSSSETRRYTINERPEPPEPRTGRYALESFLDAANFSFAGTRVRDGTPVVVFRVTSPDAFRSLPENRTLVGIDATLAVDADGIVRHFAYNATVERPGGVETVSYSHRVSDVGTTTVTPPSWLRKPQFVDRTVNRTLTDDATGATLTVAGDPRTVESVEFSRSDWGLTRSEPVLNASVSPFVAADSDPGNLSVAVTLPYDEAAVPGGDEAGLVLFVYDERVQTLVPMHSTVDAANDTVTATGIAANVSFTIGTGDDAETYTPTLDDFAERRVLVVMHAETWYATFR